MYENNLISHTVFSQLFYLQGESDVPPGAVAGTLEVHD